MDRKKNKIVNLVGKADSDLYNVLCYLQEKYGNITGKVTEAVLDRYLPLTISRNDPRLEIEAIERANNLEAGAKKIREWCVGINLQSRQIDRQSQTAHAELVTVSVSEEGNGDFQVERQPAEGVDNRDSEVEVVEADQTLAEIENMGLSYG